MQLALGRGDAPREGRGLPRNHGGSGRPGALQGALEAGLAGARIVITPHGGTKDYFQEMAHYVNPYSIEDIRTGIEQALNAPRDDGLKNHIQNNFLWKDVAQMTSDVYRKVLTR